MFEVEEKLEKGKIHVGFCLLSRGGRLVEGNKFRMC